VPKKTHIYKFAVQRNFKSNFILAHKAIMKEPTK